MSNVRELLKTVEEQQEQLQRYEKRLRDVVVAYKSLQKEKKALESTIQVLSKAPPSSSSGPNESSRQEPAENHDGSTPMPPDEGAVDITPEEIARLHDKVATLTNAMATINEEKSRMEANFQANIRELKQEKKTLTDLKNEQESEWTSQKATLTEQAANLHKKLRSQQMDRDKEQNDHAVMLRELQMLVAIERSAKEKAENLLDEMQRNLDLRTPLEKQCEEYQKKIKLMSEELQTCKEALRATKEKSQMPQPLLLKLQREIAEMKSQHSTAIHREQVRANEAEERLRFLAEAGEERVGSLELKLSELSETVGNYDRERQEDQTAIQKLKERVSQLDMENSALASVAGIKSVDTLHHFNKHHSLLEEKSTVSEDNDLDVQGLMERIVKLKGLLRLANSRSENPVKLKEFLRQEDLLGHADHSSCREELHQLKEEFEKYKLRAQSVLKNKSTRDTNVSREADTLRGQVADLRSRLRTLSEEMITREQRAKETNDELSATVASMRLRHSQELSRTEAEGAAREAELENQMQRQRSRTLALLDEKDGEIRLLKMSLGLFKPVGADQSQSDGREWTEDEVIPPPDDLARFLAVGGDPNKEAHLLHYMQEIARKDVEVAHLRRSRHELETGLRELQTVAAARDERYAEEAESLRNEIRRLTRNCAREGANLEYLKNVVLSYMLSSDVNSRRHMLNAIAALLKFSPSELDRVQVYNSSWWWQPKKAESGLGK